MLGTNPLGPLNRWPCEYQNSSGNSHVHTHLALPGSHSDHPHLGAVFFLRKKVPGLQSVHDTFPKNQDHTLGRKDPLDPLAP